MLHAAAEEGFERAAQLRDLMQALQATLDPEYVVDTRRRDGMYGDYAGPVTKER